MTSTWFEHTTIRSGVRRATIAPRSHWLAPSHMLSHFSNHCLRAIELLKFGNHRSSQSWPRFTFKKSFLIFCCRLFASLPVTTQWNESDSHTQRMKTQTCRKENALTSTWFEHATFWSGVRRCYPCATKSLICYLAKCHHIFPIIVSEQLSY